ASDRREGREMGVRSLQAREVARGLPLVEKTALELLRLRKIAARERGALSDRERAEPSRGRDGRVALDEPERVVRSEHRALRIPRRERGFRSRDRELDPIGERRLPADELMRVLERILTDLLLIGERREPRHVRPLDQLPIRRDRVIEPAQSRVESLAMIAGSFEEIDPGSADLDAHARIEKTIERLPTGLEKLERELGAEPRKRLRRCAPARDDRPLP